MIRQYQIDNAERGILKARLAAALSADARICFAYLHGSFLGDEPFHDIDAGIFLAPSVEKSSTVALELAARLTALAGLPVDVRILNMAPTSFLYHVLKGELLLVRDEDTLASVFESTVMRYLDMAPRLLQATREAFGS